MYNLDKWNGYFADKSKMRTDVKTGECTWSFNNKWALEKDIDQESWDLAQYNKYLHEGKEKDVALDEKPARWDSLKERNTKLTDMWHAGMLMSSSDMETLTNTGREVDRLEMEIAELEISIAGMKDLLKNLFDTVYIEKATRIAKAKFVDYNVAEPKVKKSMTKKEIQLARDALLVDENFLRMARLRKWSEKETKRQLEVKLEAMMDNSTEVRNADAEGRTPNVQA